MHQLLATIVLLSLSCLWDSDTLRDEARLRPDVWEVVSGQFARHGDDYYRSRVATIRALPAPDRTQRNDLAVALIRLKDYALAEPVLQLLRTEDADEYEALSNSAVLLRNQGRFAEAVPLFAQALKLRPDGHLGLGDWTLRAVRWQARVLDDPTLASREDFLGRERKVKLPGLMHDDVKSLAWVKLPQETQDHLRLLNLLLRNYTVFAEGFLTLGDELSEVDDNSLAVYAYVRALDLGHPAPELVRARITAVATRVVWWGGPLHADGAAQERAVDAVIAMVRGELAKCQAWSTGFARIEATAVAAGKLPPFTETLAQCDAQGLAPYLPVAEADRRAAIGSAWVDGLDLLKRRDFPAAEKVLAKAAAQAEKDMPQDGDRGRLLIAYAASLSPQGGKAHLLAAAKALEDAEGIFSVEAVLEREDLDMALGNLELVYAALGDRAKSTLAAGRRKALQSSKKP